MKEEGTDTPEGLIRGAQSVPCVVDSHMACGVRIPQCFLCVKSLGPAGLHLSSYNESESQGGGSEGDDVEQT